MLPCRRLPPSPARNPETRTESNGSAPLGGAHSSSGSGRDSNVDRRQHSNNAGDAAGKSTRRVPRDVETGGTDTALLAPPRKSRDATMAAKRRGAPPPLPDRPLADASAGNSSRKSASRSSDARAASNSNGSSSSSSKPRRGERDVSVTQGSGVTQSSSRGARGATGQTAAAASKDVSTTMQCLSAVHALPICSTCNAYLQYTSTARAACVFFSAVNIGSRRYSEFGAGSGACI